MSTRNKLNLLLLFAAITLGLLSVYEPGSGPDNQPKLTNLHPEEIVSIDIKVRNENTIHLVQKNKQWFHSTNHTENPIDINKIQHILNLSQSPSLRSFDATNLDLGKYALDTPKVSVTFNNITLLFGNNDPVNSRRYILVNNTVHLINDFFYNYLLTPVEHFYIK